MRRRERHDGSAVGLGVVGLGFMGRRYARFLRGIEGVRLAGVYDLDRDLAREVAAECGGTVYPDLDSLVAAADVAGVIVCTPEDRHLEPALAALAAGKPLLVEKPIAHTLDAARAIADAAARAGVPVLPGHLLRFEPRWAGAWRRIAAGEIGDVVSIATRRIGNVRDQDVLRGRTTIPLYYGVHDLDVMRWFAGAEATTIFARRRSGAVRAAGYDVDDLYCAVVTFENGVLGSAELGWHVPADRSAARTRWRSRHRHPRRDSDRSAGDRARMLVGGSSSTPVSTACSGPRPMASRAEPWVSKSGTSPTAFAAVQEPAIALADAIEALRLSLAMEESAATGEVVDLTTFGGPRPTAASTAGHDGRTAAMMTAASATERDAPTTASPCSIGRSICWRHWPRHRLARPSA